MSDIARPLAQVRDSVCAVMRIVKLKPKRKKQGPPVVQFRLAFVGTAWCIVPDRFLLTAYHVLNEGKPRDPADVFYAFTVPANGDAAYHFPVTAFPLEDADADIAALEIGPPVIPGQHIPSAPVTFSRPPDGSEVLTIGFPAPEIKGGQLDDAGHFLGGGVFFLKSHSNTGIVAAQYDLSGKWFFEFNVGWHHGESGGPVFCLNPVAAFAIMQQYRNVQTPHGIFPGPHRGRSLEAVRQGIVQLGASVE
jgi:hypothetical protein